MGGEVTDILVYWIIFNAIESERVTGSKVRNISTLGDAVTTKVVTLTHPTLK